jgi:beta-lactamase superfamily II metal-dependent hydrolase
MLDVGQGLAIVVGGPAGGAFLIDAGGSPDPRYDPGERVVLPFLVGRSGRYLDALVITHDHFDHIGGAFAILRELDVGAVWIGSGTRQSRRLSALADLARLQGTAVVLAERGRSAILGGVRVRVLAPRRSSEPEETNDGSVVLMIGEAPSRLLVPGDLERPGEASLLRSSVALRAEALVVAHHGSRSGTASRFLNRVHPRWALISAGRSNPFGHPHPEVLDRLATAGARVRRTDLVGTVEIRSGPTGWVPVSGDVDGQEDERESKDHEE